MLKVKLYFFSASLNIPLQYILNGFISVYCFQSDFSTIDTMSSINKTVQIK